MNAHPLIGNPPPSFARPEPAAPVPPPVLSYEPVPKASPVPADKPKRRSAVMPPPAGTLADDIEAMTKRLAKSLNVVADASGAFSPTAFVTALEAVHANMTRARASLSEWGRSLEDREAAIGRREHALKGAEERAAAALRLAGLMPSEAPRKKWFSR